MKPSRQAEPVHSYRPQIKRRASTWVWAVTVFALAGYFLTQSFASGGQPVGGLYVIFTCVLALYGGLSLLAAETLRLEIHAGGLVYRNAFGRISAAWQQIRALEMVKGNPILKLDENRYQSGSRFFRLLKAPYSDGTYIPVYLFLDPWESAEQLAQSAIGRDLMRARPTVFGALPPGAGEPAPVQAASMPDAAPAQDGQLIAGHYRLRSKSSLYILMALLLLAPLIMAAAGVYGGSQAVLLPGLLAGWLLTMVLGGIEVRPTPLTDLLGLGAVAVVGGLASLFLLGGCALDPGAPGCAAQPVRAIRLAFFLYPFVMYLVPWLIFTRLKLLFRGK